MTLKFRKGPRMGYIMKRDNIKAAHRIEIELDALETKLAHFKDIQKIHIASGCTLDLQNYEEPSRIGQAFREVREAICALLINQIDDLNAELKKLGVDA